MTSSSPKKIGFVSESVNYVDILTQSFSNLHQTKHADTVKMNYLSSPMVKSNSMFTLDRRRSSARRSNDADDTKSARDSPSFIKSVSSLLSRYRNPNNSSISSPNNNFMVLFSVSVVIDSIHVLLYFLPSVFFLIVHLHEGSSLCARTHEESS
uniref:Uncharacterized protein n=1 Tax=Acrobeloides nanus TaxID=290746 RepID=A0A914EIU9_9BILA